VVLVLDVLEHIEEDRKAIAEIRRVLKPNGVVISFVPAFMMLWGITDEASHHFRRYTKPELVGKLEEANFKIIRSSYFNTFLFFPILLVRKLSKFFPQKYKPEQETDIRSEFMNKVFYLIFKLESLVLRIINFPFGVSLMVIGRKV
jgi:SAM-dependent methyltransferase